MQETEEMWVQSLDLGWIHGLEWSSGGGHSNPLQDSCQENPIDRETWQATVYRVTKSQTWLKWFSIYTYTHTYIHMNVLHVINITIIVLLNVFFFFFPFPLINGLEKVMDWKRSFLIPIPRKGNAKECWNYCTIALISHTSKVMLKILHPRLQ